MAELREHAVLGIKSGALEWKAFDPAWRNMFPAPNCIFELRVKNLVYYGFVGIELHGKLYLVEVLETMKIKYFKRRVET